MNDLEFICPHCKQPLEASEEVLGEVVECPSCKRQIEVLEKAQQKVTIRRAADPLGIAALVMGIIACLFCWVPFLGLLAIPIALIGMLLASTGVVMAIAGRKTGLAFPLSGGLACLLSVLIAFAATGGCAKVMSDAVENRQGVRQAAARAPGDQQVPAAALGKRNAHPPPAPARDWIDAANAVRQGDVEVQVKEVRVGTVSLKDVFGQTRQSADELLAVTIIVSNMSAGKKIDFTTWRGQDFSLGRDFASLGDDNQNTYKRITFGAGSTPVGGVDRESIYPGKEIADVLVFERPVDAAKWLHLELPAKSFGGEGMLRFEVPATMISR